MENQDLQSETVKAQDTYEIISFFAKELPEQYKAMVYSKWLRSLRFDNDYFRLIEQKSYFSVYHAFITTLLQRPEAVVNLAVLSDNYDTVLGWSLTEPGKLHYVHVHRDNRKVGIGKALTSQPFSTITHLTTVGMTIWASKFKSNPKDVSNKPLVVFNPFA